MKTKMTSQFVLNVVVILFAKTEIRVLLLYIFRWGLEFTLCLRMILNFELQSLLPECWYKCIPLPLRIKPKVPCPAGKHSTQ